MKRLFDIVFSLVLIVVLLPVGFVVSIWIVLDDFGSPFFVQQRVGLGGKNFGLLKFRSMRKNAESKGQLTVGMKDNRITRSGYFIRKYKIDELPQLVNVFLGEMSVVGPRPEVPKYVSLYNEEQQNEHNDDNNDSSKKNSAKQNKNTNAKNNTTNNNNNNNKVET